MGAFQASVVIERTREVTYNYLRDPRNFLKLFPDSATRHLQTRLPDFLDKGAVIELSFKAMGSPIQILLEIIEVVENERIVVQQVKGPFRRWVHEQRFTDADNEQTLLTNIIDFDPPGGLLGILVTRKQVMVHLEEWVGSGHEVLRKTLAEEQ